MTAPEQGGGWRPDSGLVKTLAVLTGLALLAIGIRFLVDPSRAAQFFGIGRPGGAFDLHYVVGLRDLWLAGLLIGLALMAQWRALSLALALGALVCFGDSAIAAASSGRGVSIVFHAASGVFCAGLAWACWRRGAP